MPALPPDRPPLPKSIATVSLSGTLSEKLEAAAAIGFDGIEIFENDLLTFEGSPADIRRLAETLRGMGFHYAGRHRSKSVDLFRQGRINLILNSQQDSAAAEHFQFHGPSVCAMAFRVDHASQAVQRAETLLCPPWHESTGPGESRIPAVRAPDGTLLYLVQPAPGGVTIYDTDFNLFDDHPPGPLLTTVDHVAQALPIGRMDNFVLSYRALFGFMPEQLWEIPDTMGLIQSRAMTSAGRQIRLPLNISESRETTTGPFDDRFFFEIVQRNGGYQQYGAANASVRMAAQANRRGG